MTARHRATRHQAPARWRAATCGALLLLAALAACSDRSSSSLPFIPRPPTAAGAVPPPSLPPPAPTPARESFTACDLTQVLESENGFWTLGIAWPAEEDKPGRHRLGVLRSGGDLHLVYSLENYPATHYAQFRGTTDGTTFQATSAGRSGILEGAHGEGSVQGRMVHGADQTTVTASESWYFHNDSTAVFKWTAECPTGTF